MYIPKAFREDDLKTLHKLIREYSFATLITQHEGVPFATHLPFILDAQRGQNGSLLAHMARANPQWHDLVSEQEVLVIFQGPHAYISPSWYEVDLSVPTWNYAVVHAYGKPRLLADDDLITLLERLVHKYEQGNTEPWSMSELPPEIFEQLDPDAIVPHIGFETERDVRFDSVQTLILELIRFDFLNQPNAASLLR